MRSLDQIEVAGDGRSHLIELCVGDLTSMSPEDAVDVLVVSAFPDDYSPTPHSLIGALADKGVSVEDLALDKEIDLRDTCSCWLSKEIISADAGIQFTRILCFEPLVRGRPPEVVGDIFRSLIPFLGPSGVRRVAMPLVSTGDAAIPVDEMLPPLLDAAVHWMSVGAPLDSMKVVIPPGEGEAFIAELFSRLTAPETRPVTESGGGFKHDVLISYAHEIAGEVDFVVDELRRLGPDLRVFVDRNALNPGTAWQQDLFEALDTSRRVVAVYSPEYIRSKICQEEFNIAWARSRDTEKPVLFPIYLYNAELPTYMTLIHFADCREGNRELVRSACRRLVEELRSA